jgi:hypothetical protein
LIYRVKAGSSGWGLRRYLKVERDRPSTPQIRRWLAP